MDENEFLAQYMAQYATEENNLVMVIKVDKNQDSLDIVSNVNSEHHENFLNETIRTIRGQNVSKH